MSSPIDPNDFYTAVGPGSKFSALFDPLICSEQDLANHFLAGIVAQNGGGQQGDDCAGNVGFPPSKASPHLLSNPPDLPSDLADQPTNGNHAAAVTLRYLAGELGKLLRPGLPVPACLCSQQYADRTYQSTTDADGNGTLGIMQCEGSPQWTPGVCQSCLLHMSPMTSAASLGSNS